MLLNNAADRSFSLGRGILLAMTVSLSLFLFASAASALDGIDLSSPAAEVEEGECPALTQIKYPFLSCATGQIGQSAVDENWDNSRRMQTMSDWTEDEDIFFGPALNTD